MIINSSKKNLLFAACIGAAGFAGFTSFFSDDSKQVEKIKLLEGQIQHLEASLAKNEQDLKNIRFLSLRQSSKRDSAAARSINEFRQQTQARVEQNQPTNIDGVTTYDAPNSTQVLKDLGTTSLNDPRSFGEKANDLLSSEPTKEKVAIVSQGIFDMANDRENLPDFALQSMYRNQSDPDLKRVIAQVLSSRGNNSLIESQITEAQTQLKNGSAIERQHALTALAKTHSATAADAIAPFLSDPAIDVKLDALLAMSATGNQTHVNLVEKLLHDPDPAVSLLANEVLGNLRNLSSTARADVSKADIAAELPAMENP